MEGVPAYRHVLLVVAEGALKVAHAGRLAQHHRRHGHAGDRQHLEVGVLRVEVEPARALVRVVAEPHDGGHEHVAQRRDEREGENLRRVMECGRRRPTIHLRKMGRWTATCVAIV